MLDPNSRYFNLETSTLITLKGDGEKQEIKFIKRRFLPSADDMTTLVEHNVTQEERLDNITSLYIGDPTQYWRICDSNEVAKPTELTDEIGRAIKISIQQK